jgi:hypothetical protein
MLDKLKNREVIMFFYLTQTITPAQKVGDVSEVSITLESFFAHPYGDKLWCNDPSLKYLTMGDYKIPQDVCTKVIDMKFSNFTKVIPKTIEEFVEFLNK